MKVCLIQRDIFWAEPKKNAELIEFVLSKAQNADLYILPEMFSTGFITDSATNAEAMPSFSLGKMKQWAKDKNAAIAGSLAISENGNYYNSFFFVKPDGHIYRYDKRHLFSYGGENEHFTAGSERVIMQWKGLRFLPIVCYDLRFPVWIRNREDYDAIICVANWSAARSYAWMSLLKARAIENQCFVLAVNRVGSDKVGSYKGETCIISPQGEIISQCKDFEEDTIYGEISLEELVSFRRLFPTLNDADPFEIKL